MQITIHINNYYDWEPLPAGVEVTSEDISAKRVKTSTATNPDGSPVWLMRVSREGDTTTSVSLPESQIQALIIEAAIRDKRVVGRAEAAALYLGRHVMDHHAHRKWMRSFEVASGEPEPDAFLLSVARHVAAGNISPDDQDDLTDAYNAPATNEDIAAALASHFRVKEPAK